MSKFKTNGFMLFMSDLQLPPDMSMDEKKAVCGRRWDELTDEQREDYKEKAKAMRGGPRAHQPRVGGTSNSSLSVNASAARPAPVVADSRPTYKLREEDVAGSGGVLDATFVIADIQTWCEIPWESAFVPAEIGLVRFSIRSGIVDKDTWLVPPGEVDRKARVDMFFSSEKIHSLPVDNDFSLGFDDVPARHDQVIREILKFVRVKSRTSRPRPRTLFRGEESSGPIEVFVKSGQLKPVERSFKWLFGKAAPTRPDFRFFELDDLLYELYEQVGATGHPRDGAAVCPSKDVAKLQLEEDGEFQYVGGLTCEAHERLMVANEACAYAGAQIQAYALLKRACAAFGAYRAEKTHYPVTNTQLAVDAWID